MTYDTDYGLNLNLEKIIFLRENSYLFYKKYLHELLLKPRTRSNRKLLTYLLSLPPKTIRLKVRKLKQENNLDDDVDKDQPVENRAVNIEDDDQGGDLDEDDDQKEDLDEEDENITSEKDLSTTIYLLAYDMFIFFGLIFTFCLWQEIPRILENFRYNLGGVGDLSNIIQHMNYSI